MTKYVSLWVSVHPSEYETYLRTRNTVEADRHEHPGDGHLIVTELDTIQVQNTQTVRCDETVESKDLVHLDSGDKRASALADNVRDFARIKSVEIMDELKGGRTGRDV